MKQKQIDIILEGKSDLAVITKYLTLIKPQLGITRNHHIEVLALLIRKVNTLKGKYNNIAELRDLMVSKGKLKEFIKQYKDGEKSASVYQTLNDLRNLNIIDIYNIPKPYVILAPVMKMDENYDINIKLNVTE